MRFDDYYLVESSITNEMIEYFYERTNRHIDLVKKYGRLINELGIEGLEDIVEVCNKHDASKFEQPERDDYIFISWDYKCKDDGTEFDLPQEIKDNMNRASEHHVKNNAHHPEYYCKQEDVKFDRHDRDKLEKIVDATKMPEISLAEMVADWCAMSEELGKNTPKEWADNNVNIRWNFNDSQVKFIYDLISKIWED